MTPLLLRFWPDAFGKRVLLLAALTAVLLVPVGGSGSLERAEVYFMDGARTMVESGSWLVPMYRGEPFFDKPALVYWLIAVAFKILGTSPEAARVVSAACALGTVLATVWLGIMVAGRRAALLAGIILATTIPFLVFGHTAMADMPMTFISTLAVAVGARLWRDPHLRWPIPALGALLGLGFLAKGPVAVLLPGLALVALAWCRRHAPSPLTLRRLSMAALVALVVGSSWFVAIAATLGSEPLRYFFLHENLQRFAAATYDSGRGPLFYLWTYLVEAAPWSLFLPVAAVHALARRDTEKDEGLGWLWGAVLLMLLPLSVSRGKLDYYLLPVLPLASVIVGAALMRHWARMERWTARVASCAACLVLVAVLIVAIRTADAWRPSTGWMVIAGACTLVLVALLISVVVHPERRQTIVVFAISTGGCFALINLVWLPAFGRGQPNRAIVEDVRRELGGKPAARLAVCEDPARVHRDIIFSTRIDTIDLCEVWAITATRRPFLMLLDEREWNSLWRIRWFRRAGTYEYLPMDALGVEALLAPPKPRRLTLVANFDPSDEIGAERRKEWRRERRRALRREYQERLRREQREATE